MERYNRISKEKEKGMKVLNKIKKFFSPSSRIIIFGFLGVILIGTLLLMLPISTAGGQGASFMEALFTSTSAVCVTGLVVKDTATYWSLFGQIVILLMIQIGGMGVVMIAVTVTRLSGRKIGLMQRSTLQETISAPQVGGVVRLANFIIKTAVLIEGTGALLLSFVFVPEFGFIKGIGYAIFHSVSAFCNAGFDLMGVKEPLSSITSYSNNLIVNIVIMALIITGGIGFLTWEDIKKNKFKFLKYRMQSKVIILFTIVLIVLPAIYFYFLELGTPKWDNLSEGEHVISSLFQSVTLRTAGFNTVDLASFSESGQMIMIVVMLIGGATGSTAGGIKVTTIAVLLASALAVFKRASAATLFKRRIPSDTVHYAVVTFLMYIVLFVSGAIIISAVEKLPILHCMFETASAIATVGLSVGTTGDYGTCSKLVLIILMFFGRVGGLTIIYAALSRKKPHVLKFPQEKIAVG